MKNIVVFGNCQAQSIAKFLSLGLKSHDYTITTYHNTSRTGEKIPDSDILKGITQADILIYQPLKDSHGELSEKNILANIVSKNTKLVSFPYIFNSGAYSLIHSPRSPGRSYGKIYGDDIIIDLLEKHDLNIVLKLYKNHQIDFDLINRFEKCIFELKNRENSTHIKLAKFIEANYQKHKLFLTSNHPTTIVFIEACRQISKIVDLPIDFQACDSKNDNIANLVITKTPVSPYDINFHRYQFDSDENWFETGKELISMIAKHRSRQNDKIMSSNSSLQDSTKIDLKARMRKVRKLFEDENYHSVVDYCNNILEEYPENIPALSKSANSYEKIGSIQSAMAAYKRILQIDNSKDKVHLKLGKLLLEQNNFKGALQAYKKAVVINPDQPYWVYSDIGAMLRTIQKKYRGQQP